MNEVTMAIDPKDMIVDYATSYITAQLKKRAAAYVLSLLGSWSTGFVGTIALYLLDTFFDKVVIPFLVDMKEEGYLFLRKKELEKKLKEYINAETREEINAAFDDLISSSKFK